MPIEIEVVDQNYKLGTGYLSDLAIFAIDYLGIHPDSDLAISIVSNEEIAELHQKWMDLPGPTDVMSFPMDEMRPNTLAAGPGIMGDIVISPEFAMIEAAKRNVPLVEEIQLLLVHGILHLLGYDHAEELEQKIMFDLQEEILAKWRSEK
jgi:probable rRNA maturation factor